MFYTKVAFNYADTRYNTYGHLKVSCSLNLWRRNFLTSFFWDEIKFFNIWLVMD